MFKDAIGKGLGSVVAFSFALENNVGIDVISRGPEEFVAVAGLVAFAAGGVLVHSLYEEHLA